MFWFELTVVFSALVIGARLKGIGLGVMGGLGLVILTFGFHLQPTGPPVDVMLIIMAMITAVGTLESTGGLHLLINLAEKLIRKHPNYITFIAPFITYTLTLLTGTGYVNYSMLPVIAEVARETGIRPERPLSVSVIAAQQAITASPISAATAVLIGILGPYGIELIDILKICIPATLGGIAMATVVANKMGKDLLKDPNYLKKRKLIDQEIKQKNTVKQQKISSTAKKSVIIFFMGIFFIIFLGSIKSLRPSWEINGETVPMKMAIVIEVIMLTVSALLVLVCKFKSSEIVKTNSFTAGIQAIIAIFGIAWLGDTFFQANAEQIIGLMQSYIKVAPWLFSIFLFILSGVVVSQSTATRSLMPIGIALGIPIPIILGMFTAANGLFFIPSYPIILAAINFDRTGTTRIGKFILNHSFMLPGLIASITSTTISLILVKIFF